MAIGLYRGSRSLRSDVLFLQLGKKKNDSRQVRGVMKSYTSEYNTKKLYL